MIIHLIPILAIIGALMLISESPQWLLSKGNFNLCKRTLLEMSETEGSSLTETRPRLLRRSFPRHGGTLLCLSKLLFAISTIYSRPAEADAKVAQLRRHYLEKWQFT